MKGFKGWIEIFRGGSQVDSLGRAWDGDQVIDQAVAKFNAAEHQPPLVVGHPTEDAPAFGWVEAVRKVVKDGAAVLEAKFAQVAPEFEDWVRRGLYKTRSASFYPDGKLRHVGFLGAMPPAVKGLAPVGFSGGEGISFEFQEEKKMEIKEFLEAVKAFVGLARETGAQQVPGAGPPAQPGFSEAEVKAELEKVKAAVEAETRKKLEAEFAEKQARADAQAKAEGRKTELKGRVAALVEAGKIAPAFTERLVEVVVLADQGTKVEFAEGKSGSHADWLLHELEKTGPATLFSEIATWKKAGGAAAVTEARAEAERGRRIADPGYQSKGGK
ncbi:MAG: hypothetical protein V1816_10880 [Pseudomonadota bacterium]